MSGLGAVLREWRDTSFVYLLVPLVQTGFLVAIDAVPRDKVPVQAFVNLVVTLVIGALIAPVHLLVLGPLGRRAGLAQTPTTEWGARLGSVAVGVFVGSDLATRLLALFLPIRDPAQIRWDILRVAVVVAAVVTAILAMRGAAERREAGIRDLAERARLQALQARTEPHFLYNTLNTVAALIPTDPAAAEEAVLRLSELLRYVLGRRDRVPLREELAAVDDYLAIEALRLGDRLRVVREVDPAALGVEIPPLVLQPLVENAVVHGISSRRAGGTVTVRVGLEGGAVRLVVEDEGAGADAPRSRGAGVAQDELRQRIGPLGGELTVGPRPEGGYRAVVVVRP